MKPKDYQLLIKDSFEIIKDKIKFFDPIDYEDSLYNFSLEIKKDTKFLEMDYYFNQLDQFLNLNEDIKFDF